MPAKKKQLQGRSCKRKGSANERRAARDLNRHLTGGLSARRVPGSGAFAHRGSCGDAAWMGDVQILTPEGRIVEYVEVKVADPCCSSGPITIARMDGKGWRKHRRCLMCRHDRGEWLCSVWIDVWDELVAHHGPAPCWHICVKDNGRVRGVTVSDVLAAIRKWNYAAVLWGSAAYMRLCHFAGLLSEVYGETEGGQ